MLRDEIYFLSKDQITRKDIESIRNDSESSASWVNKL